MSSKKIVVSGATGQQGGSVVDALLAKGAKSIFGMTRSADSEKAKMLKQKGVTPVVGDMQSGSGLAAALDGADAFFLVSTPFESGTDAEAEQGRRAIDAAGEAGVGHIVFSSVSDANRSTGIPHFDSKYRIEEHLVNSGAEYTILAPAFFYDNFLASFMLPGLQNGTLAQSLPAGTSLQAVSVRTIGEFSALALLGPNRFAGRRIDYAGDELTGTEYAEAIAGASGKPISYVEVPIEQVRAGSEDMALMYEWFDKVGYSGDIAALKKEFPEITWESFSQWASRQDWSVLSD